MAKIAKIEHDRCGEWAAATYVWVDDSMTEDELGVLVEAARASYLKVEDDFKNDPDAPPAPNWQNKYSFCPDKTVREAEQLFAAREAAYKAWISKRDAARRPFTHHLVEASKGRIQSFYAGEFPLVANVSWGHRHGTAIDMGETTPETKDYGALQGQD